MLPGAGGIAESGSNRAPMRPLLVLVPLVAAFLLLPSPAHAAGRPEVAALQVALRAKGLYSGPVDGVLGDGTERAVRRLQRRAKIAIDGIPGPRTRAALGSYGRKRLGGRVLEYGKAGWDVAALQFLLASHGFPSGRFDGYFGARTGAAVRRYQRFAGLAVDGRAGPATISSLRSPPPRSPIRLAWPLQPPFGDGFGPRGARFHAGIDIPAPSGTPVSAAASGRVSFADARGSWGYLVTVTHARGVRTMYAHLSRVEVRVGQRVVTGSRLGRVGSTGHSTGPHLHFEVRVRGAAVDPLTGLR